MSGPTPDALTDVPPAAREAVSALTAAPGEPVKMLVSGGIGTGKSSVLATVRTALRTAGVAVITRAPRAGDDPAAAIVIDDAHLLAGEELDQLAERVSDPGSTIVVATEPLAQRKELRALTTALERENPVISLGSLTTRRHRRGGHFGDRSSAASGSRSGPYGLDRRSAVLIATRDRRVAYRPTASLRRTPSSRRPSSQ